MTSFSHAAPKDKTILDDMVGLALRRKAVIAITTVAVVCVVYVGLFFLPESYEATTQLEVMMGRQNADLPAAVQKGGIYPSGVQKGDINSYIQLLKGRDSAESVINTLGLEPFRFEPAPPHTLLQHIKYRFKKIKKWTQEAVSDSLVFLGLRPQLTEREKIVQLLYGALDATREGDSDVIRVAYRLPSREVAVRALGVAVQSALDRNPHFQVASKELPILEAQVAKNAEELEALQEERRRIMERGGLSSVERQKAELLQRLHKVLYSADDKRSQLAAAQARLNELVDNVARVSLRTEVEQTTVQIAGLRAGIDADGQSAGAINKELEALNSAADQLELVNLRIEAAAKRFALVSGQRDSARVNQALDEAKIANIAMISAVAAGPDPVFPNKLRFVGLGAAGGLVLGLVLAMLMEWSDDRIRGRDELARLSSLPFLGEYRLNEELAQVAPPPHPSAPVS